MNAVNLRNQDGVLFGLNLAPDLDEVGGSVVANLATGSEKLAYSSK